MNTKTTTRLKPAAPPAKKSRPQPKPAPIEPAPAAARTKAETILGLLRRANGATIAEMAAATGWQNHSVRGFLSGTVKKQRGLAVQSNRVDGVLRYRLAKGD